MYNVTNAKIVRIKNAIIKQALKKQDDTHMTNERINKQDESILHIL
jgi:hypothetical protein